jgi:hypothetical protein
MSNEKFDLTFEFDEKNDILEIHGDRNGLLFLQKKINFLLDKEREHTHLLLQSWGGELSEKKQGEENKLIPHVKIFKW